MPLLLWLLTPAPPPDAPPRAAWELPLAAALGIGVTLATSQWLFAWHVIGGPHTSNDFTNYCASIAAFNSGWGWDRLEGAGWHQNRSLVAGLLPSVLARWIGTIDALVVGAWAGSAMAVGALYLWGRALHSPTAGVTAALLAATLPSFAVLTHSANFYPEMVGGLVFSAAAAAVALRWPGYPALLVGSVGAALAFLMDSRGLLWGLTASCLVALAAVWAPRAQWPKRLGTLALALVVSFGLGRVVYLPNAATLEAEVDARRLYWDLGHRDPEYAPPWERDHRYIWGRTSPLDIPRTLAFLYEQRSYPWPDHPPEEAAPIPNPSLAPERLEPFVQLGLGGLFASALVLIRRPRQLIALAGLAPFAASMLGARDTVEAHPRFVITGTIAIPVLLGVAWAGLAAGMDRLAAGPVTRLAPRLYVLRPLLAAVIVGLMAGNVLGTVLSPGHPSRIAFNAEDAWHAAFFSESALPTSQTPREERKCRVLFKQEEERGIDPAGRLMRSSYIRRRR